MLIPVVNVTGQYNHLITRMLAELGVNTVLVPMSISEKELIGVGADGLVLGGGPQSLPKDLDKFGEIPTCIKHLEVPILGICVSHQLIATIFGGKVGPAKHPEFGPVTVYVDNEDILLKELAPNFTAWESHNDEVIVVPPNFEILAHSDNCKTQAMKHDARQIFCVQFHPEVIHTKNGRKVFKNFIDICHR